MTPIELRTERLAGLPCRRLDLPPSATAQVGDRLHTDAIGASRAGLLGVWLDRAGAATAAECAAARDAGVSSSARSTTACLL